MITESVRTPPADPPTRRRVPPKRSSPTQPGRARTVGSLIALTLGSVAFVYPFLWMIATSLRTTEGVASGGISIWPVQWKFSNYRDGLTSFPFLTYLTNTLLTTLVPVVATVLVSSLAGFAFARMRVRGSGPLFVLVLATMLLPGEVTLVPVFILFRQLDMMDTLYPMIVPSLFGSAFFIFLFRQFYLRFPVSLTEAALIDGCGWFRIWWSIHLPLSKPVAIAAAVLTFMGSWNNFITPAIYISSDRWKTLPLALAGFSNVNGTNMTLLMATTLVVIAPCVILFLLAQKHIVSGLSFRGEK